MDKRDRIRELMPLINEIKDEELRTGVVDVWLKVWEESEWEDLADCPFSLELEVSECNLIQHTNFVANATKTMGLYSRETWNIPVDMDILLAGALLHDVSKAVEDAPEKGKPGKHSVIGKNLQHGMYGVHLALEAGLPIQIAHLISCHTPRVTQLPNIPEGVFICHADIAAADTVLLRKGLPLILKRR